MSDFDFYKDTKKFLYEVMDKDYGSMLEPKNIKTILEWKDAAEKLSQMYCHCNFERNMKTSNDQGLICEVCGLKYDTYISKRIEELKGWENKDV